VVGVAVAWLVSALSFTAIAVVVFLFLAGELTAA
jgi:hypothetical protein